MKLKVKISKCLSVIWNYGHILRQKKKKKGKICALKS
jgi:hypothetical protein